MYFDLLLYAIPKTLSIIHIIVSSLDTFFFLMNLGEELSVTLTFLYNAGCRFIMCYFTFLTLKCDTCISSFSGFLSWKHVLPSSVAFLHPLKWSSDFGFWICLFGVWLQLISTCWPILSSQNEINISMTNDRFFKMRWCI